MLSNSLKQNSLKPSLLTKTFLCVFNLCIWEPLAWLSACVPHVCLVPHEGLKNGCISWNWSCRLRHRVGAGNLPQVFWKSSQFSWVMSQLSSSQTEFLRLGYRCVQTLYTHTHIRGLGNAGPSLVSVRFLVYWGQMLEQVCMWRLFYLHKVWG